MGTPTTDVVDHSPARAAPTLELTAGPIEAPVSAVAAISVREHALGVWWASGEEELRQRWEWPRDLQALGVRASVTVTFTVTATGHVQDIRVARSSGYPAYDLAAIHAIPPRLDPPPPGYSSVPLQYTFRYGGTGATLPREAR
jgi:TonB family protein